jgi:predicted transcriptional regulator
MATDKPRIQVSLDKDVNGMLSHIARQRKISKSAVAAALIEEALELQEDLDLTKLAELRRAKSAKRISHEDVWKSLQD